MDTTDHFGYATLDQGETLERHYVVLSRAWYADANLRVVNDRLDEINIGHYSSGGGTTGEFCVTLDKIGLKLSVWNDAWHLLRWEANLFQALGGLPEDSSLVDVERVLQEQGFKDATPVQDPYSSLED